VSADTPGDDRRPVALTAMEDYVVLDRLTDLPAADAPYCIHGRTTCCGCGQWCWLGTVTYEAVSSGKFKPLCMPCAKGHLPPGSLRGNLGDHGRADGPHP
jgi:hypothetical protein